MREPRADETTAAWYPDVWTCLGFRSPTACRALWHHPGTTLNDPRHRRPGPQRPLWRKRETVVHERIVQYTTVDEDVHSTICSNAIGSRLWALESWVAAADRPAPQSCCAAELLCWRWQSHLRVFASAALYAEH